MASSFAAAHLGTAVTPATAARTRLQSIDALRGLVMLFMLVDHVRETFYLHMQVTDPMDPLAVAPALFFTRMLSAVCAPVFILLTGLSAWLYGQSHTRRETSVFLLQRGLILVVLELTVVSFAWTATFPPQTLWLQVIWCIGLCMIALAGLLHVPRAGQIVLGLVIVFGHNLLDGVRFSPDSWAFAPWAILHQREFIELTAFTRARTTYPVLPWIGVIVLGYAMGPWFARQAEPAQRMKTLLRWGVAALLAFIVIRFVNVYGERPWIDTGDTVRTVMSFLSATKYPPSLMFLLPTLGVGLLLLAALEKWQDRASVRTLSVFGGAPMFFYVLHLYVLKAFYLVAVAVWGTTHGQYFGVDSVAAVWAISVVLGVALFFPSRWFAALKQRRRDLAWLRYL